MAKSKPKRQKMPKGIKLLTTTQAAYLLGVSVRTLWRLIQAGDLRPAGVIGNSNVFYENEVRALERKLYG